MTLTWLRQAGFLVEGNGQVVAIDPFLSDHEVRLFPPPAHDVIGDRLTWLAVTHEHGDHLDVGLLPHLAESFPALRVVVPAPLVSRVHELAPSIYTAGIQPGETIDLGGPKLTAVRAVHAVAMGDGYSDGRREGGTPYLGYVLDIEGVIFYHAGDTLVDADLIAELQPLGIDVAILPINGRDYFRESAGIVGNLNAREAVEMCAAIGASILVPMHHDLVRRNTEHAGACADLAVELELPVHVLSLAPYTPFHLIAAPQPNDSGPQTAD